jgi:dihydrofolate synthase/folylpolyglutamate synthase
MKHGHSSYMPKSKSSSTNLRSQRCTKSESLSGHNPACVWAVRSFLAGIEKRQPRTLIFSCLRDKALSEMAEILCPLFDHIIITQVNSPRAATLEELVIAFAATGSETIETQPDAHAALARAQKLTPSDGMIVGTGSFFLVWGLRAQLTSEHSSSNAKSSTTGMPRMNS